MNEAETKQEEQEQEQEQPKEETTPQAIEGVDWNTYTTQTMELYKSIDSSLIYNILFLGCIFGILFCKLFWDRMLK